jgi:hypothetical protein
MPVPEATMEASWAVGDYSEMEGQDVVGPLAVAGLTIAILLIAQPLSGTLWGVSLNLVGAGLAAIGGLSAIAS